MLMAAEGSKPATLSVSVLDELAQKRTGAKARIDLPSESSEVFRDIEPLLPSDKGRIPNYARAVASLKGAPAGFAHMVRVFLYDGSIEPETKMAMALRMAQVNGNPYT